MTFRVVLPSQTDLSKPGFYITHNATQPLTVGQGFRCDKLVAEMKGRLERSL